MVVTISEVHNRLSYWLKRIPDQPLTITDRGKPVGVLVSPEEYERLRQVRAYLDMLRLAHSLRDSGLTAGEVYEASRRDLEDRP